MLKILSSSSHIFSFNYLSLLHTVNTFIEFLNKGKKLKIVCEVEDEGLEVMDG